MLAPVPAPEIAPAQSESAVAAGPSILAACRAARTTRALLLLNLRDRKSGAYCDTGQDGMPWVARQAHIVRLFPSFDANVRGVFDRALCGEYELPFLQTFFGFVGQSFGVGSDRLSGGTRCGLFVHRVLRLSVIHGCLRRRQSARRIHVSGWKTAVTV